MPGGYGPTAPPGYPAPAYPAPAYPTPQQPPNPLLDEQLRYRQVLGAYYRPPNADARFDGKRTHYTRVADASRRRHDGFYFRFALGIGVGHDSMSASGVLPTSQELSFEARPFSGSGGSSAATTELAFGFTPASGFAVGLGVYTASLLHLLVDVNDPNTGTYSFRVSQLAIIGPFADWYFDPASGLHAELTPGLATYVAGVGYPEIAGALAQAHTALGFGVSAGLGYDWWIGDQWSIGILGRLLFGVTSGTDNRHVGWSHATYAPAALLTATYH
jgi:hypothetical protein